MISSRTNSCAKHGPQRLSVRFMAAWLFIAFVSVHDAYLVVMYREVIRDHERNPLCNYLIALNDGDVWILLAAKAVGTVVVCAALLILVHRNQRLGWLVTKVLACMQLYLLLYLTWA